MGCDIHMILQAKGPHDKMWSTYILPDKYVGRDYSFFGILAGVRSIEYEPVSGPKGLPDDLTIPLQDRLEALLIETHLDPDNPEYHSQTYLSMTEIDEYLEEKLEDMTYFKEGSDYDPVPEMKKLRELHDFMKHFKVRGGEVRLVMGFDN